MTDDQRESDALVQLLKTGAGLRAPYQCPRCALPYWTTRSCSGRRGAPHDPVPVEARAQQ